MMLSAKAMKFLIGLLLIAGAASSYSYAHRNQISTDNATIEGHTVTLSPKVQGYVKTLYISDNQQVKKGDLLVEIDPTDYIIRRDKAKAALAAAKAAVKAAASTAQATSVSAPSEAEAVQAEIAAAEATWQKTLADRKRLESLFKADACSKQQLDAAIAAEKSSRAAVEKLAADLRSAGSAPHKIAAVQNTSVQLAAQVEVAKAELALAETDLANTKIYAPMDGRITKRSIEAGAYVQAGSQLFSLVGHELWIIANFKETQLKGMQPGQKVDIRIDAFPNVTLHGRIDSFQAGTGSHFSLFPAENATGNFVKTVQRVPVKIVFETPPDDALPLGPGMSVIPTIYTDAGSKP